jgi:hypothetical protein
MERLNVTEPHNKTPERIAQLSSMLTREGIRFFEQYKRRGEAALCDGASNFEKMANQAWFAHQFRLLPPHDREIIMEVIQLKVIGGLGVEKTVEEMIEDAHENHDRALIAYAQQLQAYSGEPLRQDTDVREAGEVLKRLLFEPDV